MDHLEQRIGEHALRIDHFEQRFGEHTLRMDLFESNEENPAFQGLLIEWVMRKAALSGVPLSLIKHESDQAMKKKTVRIALALCGLLFVASNKAKRKKLLSSENVEATQAEPTYELIGQRVQLLYDGGMKAEVQYLNDTTLHRKTTVNGSVAEERNTMVQRRIDNSRFFVNWIENDGTTTSQVLDFKAKTVTVFLTFTGPGGTRNSQLLTGRLELLRE